MNLKRTSLAAALFALAISSSSVAAELTLPADGWVSWQAAAVADAPDMCCWVGTKGDAASRSACKLDDQRGNLGNRDNAKTDAVRVYARLKGGKVERLRALSASCPVETLTPIRELGEIEADDSMRWLIALSRRGDDTKKEDARDNVISAIAMHRGDVAYDGLADVARNGEHLESRKSALFWLAKARGVAGADLVSQMMFGDRDPELREHAAFAITESRSPRIAQDLIRLGNTDKDGEVRSQAWFWLAETGAVESETAIGAALRKDADDHVREQAIFALSQLRDERGTRALISLAEDRSLPAVQRKRAVFWLAQSEANGAHVYLEKVLAGKVRP
ncbi:MAG: HEAT repeat domain-containing protein [Steroidobacteraceae bacterium]|nr:HEAT repeat domain-containing protein [Steroidobacteraceae bacterium]